MAMHVTLHFTTPGYIGHPYWPAQYKKIEIEKRSGVNRVRDDAKRRKALEQILAEHDMSFDDWLALCREAERPFHINGDGFIYIPSSNILAALVNAMAVAPAKLRIRSLRTALEVSDFVTPKKAPDGIWSRFTVVTLGTGAKASNQRGLRENAYIHDFDATGTLTVDTGMVEPQAIITLLEFCGRDVGIGASRKMGWGRFTVTAEGAELTVKPKKSK
jgi:hypothetical protein